MDTVNSIKDLETKRKSLKKTEASIKEKMNQEQMDYLNKINYSTLTYGKVGDMSATIVEICFQQNHLLSTSTIYSVKGNIPNSDTQSGI